MPLPYKKRSLETTLIITLEILPIRKFFDMQKRGFIVTTNTKKISDKTVLIRDEFIIDY